MGLGGAPFRFARGTYPAVMGGGLPAPNMPTFPQAFNPGAGASAFSTPRLVGLGVAQSDP